MKIAFLGLGKMGLGSALLLVKAGYEVHTAVHVNSQNACLFRAEGGMVEESFAAAVKDADVIFTIVPDDAALKSLLLDEAFKASLKPGAVLVEMTSCSAEAVCEVAKQYECRRVDVLDAPVSGGVAASVNGTMTMICAGDEAVFEKVRPLLEIIGEHIVLVSSKVGDGKKIKSLNNLLAAINRAATGEVARLAEHNGLDPEKVFDVISHSSGNSAAFQYSWKRIQANEYQANFTVAHMRKDVKLALDLADGMCLPIAKQALDYYEKACVYDSEDSCAVAKVRYEI